LGAKIIETIIIVIIELQGLLKGKEPNKMRLGLCSRSGDILEPMITPQWYVNCNDMAKRSTDAVRNGELKIIPADHEKTWFHWLDNIRDWCVSRQLWWGHQIPAWFATTKAEGETIQKFDMTYNDRWIVARSEEDAKEKALAKLGCTEDELVLVRDEDVLDTWFSSGLFPFSVMGWPDNTADMKAFYPTSLLETGLDIIFFWVARMVMMGLELTDTLPFHTVFLHAMVRDKEGRKMSKSLGNVIDPLEVIRGCTLQALQDRLDGGNLPAKEVARAKKNNIAEFPDGIPQCGSDAHRFGLLAYTVQGKDINLDVKRVVGYRNFCNKMWNSTRFALMYLQDFQPTPTLLEDLVSSGKMSIRDQFMISRLMKGTEAIDSNFTSYKFGDAQQAGYQLWLNDMCDVYLELIKPIVQSNDEETKDARWAAQATLWVALETQLRGLHPMMPFITEELWQRLPGRGTLGENEKTSIMLTEYPVVNDSFKNDKSEESMSLTLEIVKACRSLRSSYNIQPKDLTHFFVKMTDEGQAAAALTQVDDIKTLGSGSQVDINPPDANVPDTVGTMVVNDSMTVLVDLKGMVDFKTEIGRLNKNLGKAKGPMEQLEKKMVTSGYQENVPEDLKQENVEKLSGLKKKCADIEEAIVNFERLLNLEDK
jgi:valyl-tRNA synthetase